MTSEHLLYWSAAIFPPLAAFVLNAVVRGREILKSSGADWLLIFFGFDLTGLLTLTDLASHVTNPDLRDFLPTFISCSLVICIIFWLVVVLKFEPMLASISSGVWEVVRKIVFFSITWIFVVAMSASHILFFMQRKIG